MSCHHCVYLMRVSKRFPQHLLNVSHDGYLLMGSQGIFYPLGGWCTLVEQNKGNKVTNRDIIQNLH